MPSKAINTLKAIPSLLFKGGVALFILMLGGNLISPEKTENAFNYIFENTLGKAIWYSRAPDECFESDLEKELKVEEAEKLYDQIGDTVIGIKSSDLEKELAKWDRGLEDLLPMIELYVSFEATFSPKDRIDAYYVPKSHRLVMKQMTVNQIFIKKLFGMDKEPNERISHALRYPGRINFNCLSNQELNHINKILNKINNKKFYQGRILMHELSHGIIDSRNKGVIFSEGYTGISYDDIKKSIILDVEDNETRENIYLSIWNLYNINEGILKWNRWVPSTEETSTKEYAEELINSIERDYKKFYLEFLRSVDLNKKSSDFSEPESELYDRLTSFNIKPRLLFEYPSWRYVDNDSAHFDIVYNLVEKGFDPNLVEIGRGGFFEKDEERFNITYIIPETPEYFFTLSVESPNNRKATVSLLEPLVEIAEKYNVPTKDLIEPSIFFMKLRYAKSMITEILARKVASLINIYHATEDFSKEMKLTEQDLEVFEDMHYNGKPVFGKNIEKYRLVNSLLKIRDEFILTGDLHCTYNDGKTEVFNEGRHFWNNISEALSNSVTVKYEGKTYNWPASRFNLEDFQVVPAFNAVIGGTIKHH
ncbi:hypothetical protein ACFL0W_02965 [Nanoarchaeota archaeon]